MTSSSNRVAGLAKYLVVLAGSFDEAPPVGTQPRASAKRRRLHMLYLLHDLLHHTKYHLDGNAAFSTVSGSLQPFMVDLLGHAAAYDRQKHPKHHSRLDQLLGYWSDHKYFSFDLIQQLREVVRNGATTEPAPSPSNDVSVGEADPTKKQSRKDAPVIVPPTHGDSAIPRHDLPAGNLVPHVIPNSSIPVYADSMKPLQFMAGPAAAELVHTLKSFLNAEDEATGTEDLAHDEGGRNVINGLALVVPQNETARDYDSEAYFAWAPAFGQQTQEISPGSSPSRSSRSRSRSHSRARNELKRRRDSDSPLSRDGRRSVSPPWKQSRRDDHEEFRDRSRSPRESSYSPPPPTQFHPPVSGTWPGPPPPMPTMPFPPSGPWMGPSAFPPPYPGPPPPMSMPMPMPPGQSFPGGQLHFPPPHPANQQGNAWGGRGRGGPKNW